MIKITEPFNNRVPYWTTTYFKWKSELYSRSGAERSVKLTFPVINGIAHKESGSSIGDLYVCQSVIAV